MADNLTTGTTLSSPPSGSVIGTRQVTYSGDSVHVAPVGLVAFSGADDAKAATDIPAGGGTEATALRVTVATDSTGVLSVDDNGGSLTVDGTVAVSAVTSITNVVHVDDNTGSLTVDGTVAVSSVGGTVASTQSGTWTVQPGNTANTTAWKVDGSAVTQPVSGTVTANQGGTWTVQPGNTANTTAWKVDGSAVTQPVSIATNQPVGTVAHDGVDSGNPLKIGAKAISSLKTTTLVSSADRTDNQSDLDGAVIDRAQFPLGDLLSERVSDTGGSSTAFTNFSAVASTKNYITGATVYRTDAGTSLAYVDFRDGTAGSILWSLPLPPNGGAVLPAGAVPYFRTSANTALAYDVSAALTTVYISVTGFQSKV